MCIISQLIRHLVFILLILHLSIITLYSQSTFPVLSVDTLLTKKKKNIEEKDLIDIIHQFKKKKYSDSSLNRILSMNRTAAQIFREKKYQWSIVPAVGYTLQTGFAGIISGNLSYYNDTKVDGKQSSITASLTYSQYSQIIVPLFIDIWTKNAEFSIISDNRLISYPSSIYGLGGRIDPALAHTINFTSIKLHEKILKKIIPSIYVGGGIYYDEFWDIKAIDQSSRRVNALIERRLGSSERAVGMVATFLYDSRTNQNNPDKGIYLNVTYRDNQKIIGSDNNWQSLLIDARTYISFPKNSTNTIALWSYNWLTTRGNPPYLLLPSTGWDDQYNTGRGYIQSRFRGKNMIYFETEYRYKITRNGLIGGVAFINVESFSGDISNTYTNLYPGYGAGIRIKINKYSKTNICLDYGIGNNGRGGFYVNFNEVF